jgi:arginine N-succinyltransferase
VPLLPGDAQAALGQIHPSGQLAFNLLTQEGFEADEYIDIFDGGPILQAHRNALRSFCASQVRQVENAGRAAGSDELVTYAVASGEQNFRAVIAACPPADSAQVVCLPREAQQALGISAGDSVTCVRI